MMSDEGIRVLEQKRIPGEGLKLILTGKKAVFGRVYDMIYDGSIPEAIYREYERASRGREAKDKIIILLGLLGYSYPTSAISAATGIPKEITITRLNGEEARKVERVRTGVSRLTVGRLLSELVSEGLVANVPSDEMGSEIDYRGRRYKTGPLDEAYRILTRRGYEQFERYAKMYGIARVEPSVATRRAEPFYLKLPGIAKGPFGELLSEEAGGLMVLKEKPPIPGAMTPEEREWYIYRQWRVPPKIREREKERYLRERAKLPKPSGWRIETRPITTLVPYEEKPLVPIELLEAEMKEHPWLDEKEAKKIVEDHLREHCTHPAKIGDVCIVCGRLV